MTISSSFYVLYSHPDTQGWVQVNMGLPMTRKAAEKHRARLEKKGCSVRIIRHRDGGSYNV